jgi:hypothetical protein
MNLRTAISFSGRVHPPRNNAINNIRNNILTEDKGIINEHKSRLKILVVSRWSTMNVIRYLDVIQGFLKVP